MIRWIRYLLFYFVYIWVFLGMLFRVILYGKIKTGKDTTSDPVKLCGHTFYYINPRELPVIRAKGYQRALTEVDWGLTKKDLWSFTEMMRTFLNNGDLVGAATTLGYFDNYRANYASNKVLLIMANNFILVDDEPLNEYSPRHTNLKAKLCEKHPEIEDFFLSKALGLTVTSPEQWNISDVKDYLKSKEVIESESLFLNTINTNRYHWENAKGSSKK